MTGEIKDVRVTKGAARYGRPRHDVPQPKLGLFLGTMWLGIWRAVGIIPHYLNDWFKELFVFRTTARVARFQKGTISDLRGEVNRLHERLHYMQMDMQDLENYTSPSIPSFAPGDVFEMEAVEQHDVQAILFHVRSFRAHYQVAMMDLKLARDGNRWLAEEIAVKMSRFFASWCYVEMCRELKVPKDRESQTTNRILLEGL